MNDLKAWAAQLTNFVIASTMHRQADNAPSRLKVIVSHDQSDEALNTSNYVTFEIFDVVGGEETQIGDSPMWFDQAREALYDHMIRHDLNRYTPASIDVQYNFN